MSVSAASLARVRLKVIPTVTATKATEGGATGGTDNSTYMTPLRTAQAIDARRPFASQPEAEAGADNTKTMTPLRTKQQVDARLVDQATAEAGTDNVELMTPLRTKQQIDARLADQATAEAGADNTDLMTPLRSAQSQAAISAPKSRTLSYTGAVSRTFVDAARDAVDIREFGAVIDGVADDTAAFQKAADSGRKIYLPKGVYVISDEIDITMNGLQFSGEGVSSTHIYQTALNKKIFNVTGDNFRLSGVSLDYVGTPTSGATAITLAGGGAILDAFIIYRAHKGIEFTSVDCQVRNFFIYSYSDSGLYINGAGGLVGGMLISQFLLHANNPGDGATGGIVFEGQVEGCMISSGNVLGGALSLLTLSASWSAGACPSYNSFTDVYFDGADRGSYVDKVMDFAFTGCWFSGGRTGIGYPGVTLGASYNASFVNSRFNNCGSHGALVLAASSLFNFTACKFIGNSGTTGAGVSDGLHISANTNGFTVSDCIATNLWFVGTQRYGIYIEAGSSSGYALNQNYVQGNAVGGIFDGGSGGNRAAIANIGYLTAYRGSGTVSGGTSAVISHFLSATPTISDILILPQADISTVGVTRYWVSNVTSTQFTINVNTTPSSPLAFTFDARVKGA